MDLVGHVQVMACKEIAMEKFVKYAPDCFRTLAVALGVTLVLLLGCGGGKESTPTPDPTPPGIIWERPRDEMVMVYVPAGVFEMGSKEGNDDEQPVHTVALNGFWIDKYEVTNEQYRRCVEAEKCQASTTCRRGKSTYGEASKADHPIVCVNWQGAQDYCEWAGARLPTETEWEYAARGPAGLTYPWGNEFDCAKGNFDDEAKISSYIVPGGESCDGFERTAPVGSFPDGTSWCGAEDMAGNVWEWVMDWHGEYLSGRRLGSDSVWSSSKVMRGGSWLDDFQRSAARGYDSPTGQHFHVGFRCARDSE